METNRVYTISAFLLYCCLGIAALVMLNTIFLYSRLDDTAGFLAFKQEYLGNKLWKTAFYVHVFTSLVVLVSGISQFSTGIRQHYPRLHRTAGWVYIAAILCINFPAGMIMAVNANGLLPSRIAFILLDLLWAGTTLAALIAAKRRDFQQHSRWMIISYALTLSAITLRLWKKLILAMVPGIDPLLLYQLQAWLGFVPNLLVALLVVKKKRATAQN